MKYKKFYISIICVLSIFISSINVYATGAVAQNINPAESIISTEGKIICNATLADDFADDSVIIVINKEYSKREIDFGPSHFKNVEIEEIRSITSPISDLSTASETAEEAAYKASTLALTNVENFRQIIKVKLKNTGKENVLKAIKEFEKIDYIESAEPNYISTIPTSFDLNKSQMIPISEKLNETAQPNIDISDDLEENQYALGKIDITSAWDISTGSESICVGIIDSGISNHPDLTENLMSGWDFHNDEEDTTDDPIGHGTFVAGIIGAKGKVLGVNHNVSLVPLQVVYRQPLLLGGRYAVDNDAVYDAVEYARTHNIPIINCSIEDNISPAYRAVMENYNGLIVCAAGNESADTDKVANFPSCFPFDNIISVAATTSSDTLALFSNYGKTTVDLGAPGDLVYSTYLNNDHITDSGTSYAAPFVTGVAALLMSVCPEDYYEGDDYIQYIKNLILDSVDKVPALEGKCLKEGRLNAYKAVEKAKRHYTIKYNANGGSGAMDKSVIVYDVPTQTRLNEFTRNGYDFDCWYAYRASDNKWRYQNSDQSQHGWYVEGSQPTGWTKFRYDNGVTVSRTSSVAWDTITFYAQWKKYYTIKYNSNGGISYMDDTKVYYGVSTPTRENTFVAYGNEFDCWYAHRASDDKWRYQNSDKSQSGWYSAGSQPTGWTKYRYENGVSVYASSSVPGDIVTFYAQWKKYYTVVYDANSGTGSMASTQFYCGIQNRLAKNAFAKNGHDFDCWHVERYSDHKWKYVDNNGNTSWYTMGEQPSWMNLYRYEDRGIIFESDVASNEKIILHAQWKKYFIIRYHKTEGSGSMPDTKVYYGVSTQVSPNSFERSGYTFDCWFVDRESDNKWRYQNPNNASQTGFYLDGKQPSGWTKFRYEDCITVARTSDVAGDIVNFHAQWKKHFYIVYNSNGGYGYMPRTKVVYGVQTYLAPNTFTNEGYEFLYWYAKRGSDNKWRYRSPDEESSGWYLEGQQPEGWTKYPYYDAGWVARTASNPGETVTLYAQWEQAYIIQYDANGGEGTMPDTVGSAVEGDEGLVLLPECTFTNEGYDFGGWNVYDATYDVWAYSEDGEYIEWYAEGEQPYGYYKHIIYDQSYFRVVSDVPTTYILYAVWLEK